jgi:malonyl-CoA/methylmalonyl-CoA synthetase
VGLYHRMVRRWSTRGGVAVESDGIAVSFGSLDERVRRAAGWLRGRGLRAGDVVLIALPRSLELLELHLAGLATGIVTVPANERYTASELDYLASDSGAKLRLESLDGIRAALDAAAPDPLADEPADDAIATICYTSGTTGRPKGAILTHANLAGTIEGLHEAWRWSSEDVLIHALPLFHIHGLFVAAYGALWAGARQRWLPRFDAALALDALADGGGTVFMGVPTFYQRLVDAPIGRWDVAGVRLFTCGSAGLPAHVFEAFRQRFGHTILERYGMTECGIVLSNPYDDRRAGDVGVSLPGVEAHIADPESGRPLPDGAVGELRIRGPGLFRGYLNAPDKTEAAFDRGFLRTGDLATQMDGRFRIVGRHGDMLITGGFNVYPSELEAVLAEHPAVAEVAVVGVIDPDLGERAVATVVARQPVEVEDLRAFAATRLTGYKVPKAFRLTDALPRNAMGKVQKKALKAEWHVPSVRPARADEAPLLAANNVKMALETEQIALDPAIARRGAEAVFARDVGASYLVAEIAGSFAGQLMITTEWSDWRDRVVWWIQSVYVAPAFRGRGVYQALHDAVIARARAAGAGGVRLYVDRRNQRAMGVYRKVGMNGDHYAVFEQMFDEPPAAGGPGYARVPEDG